MSDLSDFLLARIDEDEAWTIANHECVCSPVTQEPGCPARINAECEAKRRIVAEHQGKPDGDFWGDSDPIDDAGTACTRCGTHGEYAVAWPCLTLRALALPYADHPDYREEWKP